MDKVKRIKKEDYDFFSGIVPYAKSSKDVFSEVKKFTIKGVETVKAEKKLDKVGELLYGKKVWKKIFE